MDGRPPPPPPPPPPPRPPPPPPAVAADARVVVVNDNDGSSSRQTRMPTPPSVLRDASIGSRNARNGSVAFIDGVNDASNRPSSSSSSAARKATSAQLQRPAPITLNRVISSQFENEAETHIIAALEMEDGGVGVGRQQSYGGYGGTSGGRNELDNNSSAGGSRGLLGEGIEGMEDYSDDDDDVGDDNNNGQAGGRQRQQQQGTPAATSNRGRTLSTDSFLRKVAAMQNELPQYQRWADESNASTEYSSSPANGATTVASSATYTRMRGKGMMAADDDDGDGDNGKNDGPDPPGGGGGASRTSTQLLAMHIRRETEAMYEGDDVFVEAAMQEADVAKDGGGRAALPVVAAAAAAANDDDDDDDGGGESTTHNEDGERGAGGERRTIEGGTGHGGGGSGAVPAAPAERNIMTDATETTDNMNLMVDRLRSLQQRRASFQRGGGGGSISASISSGGGGGGGGEDDLPESSGDRLIAALNSVDSSKDSSFYAKIHSEYTELIVPKIPQFRREISIVLFYVAIPCLVVASLLFYMFDNPMAGDTGTSISWWILFVGVRQPIIFEFTRMGEVFWVEIFALRSKLFNRAVGPYVSLAFIQSSGW
ncbi:hypothetical protein ACHAW5_005622 [Stephanodiscus triporus]|uniref:Uncharacterized protein n=1 Tax=Stephanodiscus triporus TaxID=2934178 RepID=A0ABD3PMM7_9STRA